MKFTRPRPDGRKDCLPSAMEVVAIRCTEHSHIPVMNLNADDESECGCCLGAQIADGAVDSIVNDLLDGYAARLSYGAMLRAKVEAARVRLDMLQPGAGDFLTEDDDAG